MEQKFDCKRCGDAQSVQMLLAVKKAGMLAVLICKKGHMAKRKLKLEFKKYWEPIVIERLYKCPKCGRELTYLDRKTFEKKTILAFSCPTHGKVQKSIPTSFWLYSIESKKTTKSVNKLFCMKCGFPQSIETLIVGKKGGVLAELTCKNGHMEKQKFEMSKKADWITGVVNSIYTCPKCGLDMIDLDRKIKDRKATLFLNCSVHGKIKKNLSVTFLDSIETFKRQLASISASSSELIVIEGPPEPPKKEVKIQSIHAVLGFHCPDCKSPIRSVRYVECGELTANVKKCEICGGTFSYLVCRVCRMEIPLNEEAITCPECGKLIKNVRCDDCGELNYNVRGCDHCASEFGNLICGDCGTNLAI